LTVSDVVKAVGTRADISVVGVYLEGFANLDGAEMLRAVADLRNEGKSVVFYKAGRTESGRSAAAGHTAAVAGDYDICQSAMRHAGAFVAEDFREFGQALEFATAMVGRTSGQGRVFALTNAGMEAVAIADAGIRLDWPSDSLKEELDKLLVKHGLRGLVSPRNPLDLTPAAGEDAYDDIVCAALDSDETDLIIVSCVPLAPRLKTLGADLNDPTSFPNLAKKWVSASSKGIVAVFDGGPEYEELIGRTREAGLPVFRSADEAARLIGRWIS
jgi:acyl-CoA synthetase (NDP forming)